MPIDGLSLLEFMTETQTVNYVTDRDGFRNSIRHYYLCLPVTAKAPVIDHRGFVKVRFQASPTSTAVRLFFDRELMHRGLVIGFAGVQASCGILGSVRGIGEVLGFQTESAVLGRVPGFGCP